MAPKNPTKKPPAKRSAVPKKIDFFDVRNEIVRSTWERIFEYALVSPSPIVVSRAPLPTWNSSTKTWSLNSHVVPLVDFAAGMSEIGVEIYFSQNTFHFKDREVLWHWKGDNKKAVKLLTKAGLDCTGNLSAVVTAIKRFPSLQELRLGIDEKALVATWARPESGYRRVFSMRPQDIDFQLNLFALRANGMDKLRELRIPKFAFTALIHGSEFNVEIARATTGPIPGGVLETIVAKEITSAREVTISIKKPLKRKAASTSHSSPSNTQVKVSSIDSTSKKLRAGTRNDTLVIFQAKEEEEDETKTDLELHPGALTELAFTPTPSLPPQPFRFLDLPAELRNRIYQYTLLINGKILPSTRLPTTYHRSGTRVASRRLYRPGPPRCSVLALLQTNRQIYREALGFYYSANTFVFYYPPQLLMFLQSVSEERKQYISTITLWYMNQKIGGMDTIGVALMALFPLRSLRVVEVVLDDGHVFTVGENTEIPGEQQFKELSARGVDLRFRSQEVDTFFWRYGIDAAGYEWKLAKMRARQSRLLVLERRMKSGKS